MSDRAYRFFTAVVGLAVIGFFAIGFMLGWLYRGLVT